MVYELETVREAVLKLPMKFSDRLYYAVRGISDRELVKLSTHKDIPPEMFLAAFLKLCPTKHPVPHSYLCDFFNETFKDLCYTHQEEKMDIMVRFTYVDVSLPEIFLHGDPEALVAILKVNKTQNFLILFMRPFFHNHHEELKGIFRPSVKKSIVEEQNIKKRRLILENINILSTDDLFVLFDVMVENDYPFDEIVMKQYIFESQLREIIEFQPEQKQLNYTPRCNRVDVFQRLLESFPDMEIEMDKFKLFGIARGDGLVAMNVFLRERYPEIDILRKYQMRVDTWVYYDT